MLSKPKGNAAGLPPMMESTVNLIISGVKKLNTAASIIHRAAEIYFSLSLYIKVKTNLMADIGSPLVLFTTTGLFDWF
jgi:hypothetical protein